MELIKQETLVPAKVFKEGGMKPILDEIKKQAKSLVPDMSTAAGRKAIISNANDVARSKTLLDKIRKELIADRKKEIDDVNAAWKMARDFLDELKVEIRKPVTDFEDREKERVAKIKTRIAEMQDIIISELTIDDVKSKLIKLESTIIDDSFAEFKEHAEVVRKDTIRALDSAYTAMKKAADDKAELEKLQKEKAEREQKESEENIRKEVEAKAELDKKEAAKKAEADKKKAVEDERKRLEDEAAEKERKRLEDERAAESEKRLREIKEKEKSENKKHRAKINKKATSDLSKICDLPNEQAKYIIDVIAEGKIPNVTINY